MLGWGGQNAYESDNRIKDPVDQKLKFSKVYFQMIPKTI